MQHYSEREAYKEMIILSLLLAARLLIYAVYEGSFRAFPPKGKNFLSY